MTAPDRRAAGIALVAAPEVNLLSIENEADSLRRAIDAGSCVDDEAEERLFNRFQTLQWAIAEASANNHQDMAVKVRLWQRSIDAGEAVWDGRLAETLLDALEI